MSNPVLSAAVHNALAQSTPLRVWMSRLTIDAQDNTVTLTGVVRSRATKTIAVQIARSVPGVSQVQNKLVADEDTEVAVAQALGADARTRNAFPGVLVGVVFGVAFLKGVIASEAGKNAAGEISAQVAGVERVSNELTVA